MARSTGLSFVGLLFVVMLLSVGNAADLKNTLVVDIMLLLWAARFFSKENNASLIMYTHISRECFGAVNMRVAEIVGFSFVAA
jgi:hypothetical protein